MTDHDARGAGWAGYRALGLVDNPFRIPEGTGEYEIGTRAATRATALRTLSAVEEALAAERLRPVRVVKPSDIPAYYPRSVMTTVLRELGTGSQSGLLPVYVQLIMMRKGRIRGTLSALAELLVARSIDTTIAHYAHRALGEPDTSLDEWLPVETLGIEELVEKLEAEPETSIADLFGPLVDLRDSQEGGIAEVMRASGMRQAGQELDPAEDDDTSEDDVIDRLDALVDDAQTAPAELEAQGESEAERIAEERLAIVKYVIAHAKKHASPVIARGLKAYVDSGTAAMAQELKVTRAPRKTLGALARFAGLTFRSVVIIYDGFEAWPDIPEDLRATIVSGLSEVRLALGGHGTVLIAGSDDAPEIDDQFATAIRVDWAIPELEQIQEPEASCDAELLKRWLKDAALPGADVAGLAKRVEGVCLGAQDLASGVALAADEVEKAATDAMRSEVP